MNDQAEKLRSLVKNMKSDNKEENGKEERNINSKDSAYIYTITSGKGGVGKSNFTVNLALALREQEKEVIIFDADLGMANLDVILGVNPKYNLSHVIAGTKSLEEIIVEGPDGLPLIPGGSGVQELANLSQYQIDGLINNWSIIEEKFDIILIDTGAGLSNNVVDFILAANEIIIISTPEPTSITDAYGVIKVAAKYDKEIKIKLVINQAENDNEGERVSNRLINTAHDFLNLNLELLGVMPQDDAVIKAVKRRRPFFLQFPKSKVTRSMKDIGNKLIDKPISQNSKGIKGFFYNLLNR